MFNVLHSFYKPICLALLTVLGLAFGHLIDSLLQMKLQPEFIVENAMVAPISGKSTKITQTDLNKILQNNIFDTVNRSRSASMGFNPAQVKNVSSASTTRSDLKLFGTVVASDRSQALIEYNKELKLFHLGDTLPGDGSIEEIRRNQVDIRNPDQNLTTLFLHESNALSERAASTNRESRRDSGEEIKEVGDNRWMVSKNMVEGVRENFADDLRLAQVEPHMVDGKTDGFLVRSINRRSILIKMGI